MHNLTAFQRDILYILGSFDRPKGLKIKDELEDYYPEVLNHGRLYPNLDELVRYGYAEKGKKDERTNEYWLTERGEALLQERREWEDEQMAAE